MKSSGQVHKGNRGRPNIVSETVWDTSWVVQLRLPFDVPQIQEKNGAIYTKPWVALDKMRFEIQPDDFDVREFICAPSEYRDYNKELGDPASTK